MIRGIIFDCFGVMVTDAVDVVMTERQASAEDRQNVWDLVYQVNKSIISEDEYHEGVSSILGMKYETYKKLVKDHESVNRPLLDYVVELRKTYRVGMLSNVSSMDSLYSRFQDGELDSHFDAVVASGSVGFAKPEAQAYEIIVDKLGLRLNECVMIDDIPDYCQGAVGVGMKAIQYRDFDQMKAELEAILAA